MVMRRHVHRPNLQIHFYLVLPSFQGRLYLGEVGTMSMAFYCIDICKHRIYFPEVSHDPEKLKLSHFWKPVTSQRVSYHYFGTQLQKIIQFLIPLDKKFLFLQSPRGMYSWAWRTNKKEKIGELQNRMQWPREKKC